MLAVTSMRPMVMWTSWLASLDSDVRWVNVDWDKGEIVRDLTVSYDGNFDGRNTRDSYIISMEGKKEIVVPTMLDVERYVRAYAAFAKLEENHLKALVTLFKS